MTRGKTRLLYILYILGLTTFFIYRLFPDEAVRRYLNFRLKTAHPNFSLTAVQAKPTFPPGLKLEKMNIYHNNLPLLDFGVLKIEPDFRSLFSPGQKFKFQGNLYGGTIKGQLELVPQPPSAGVVVNAALSGIQVGGSAVLERLVKRKISGILQGTVLFESHKKNGDAVSAELNFSDCKVEISASLFGMENLCVLVRSSCVSMYFFINGYYTYKQ